MDGLHLPINSKALCFIRKDFRCCVTHRAVPEASLISNVRCIAEVTELKESVSVEQDALWIQRSTDDQVRV